MVDEGKYLHLWMKYAAVIQILLKKTEVGTQKLQLYKHEFEHCSQKQNANFTCSFNLINGRALNTVSTTSIARDLWQVLDSNSTSKAWLKEHKIKVSIGKSFELQFEKIVD